MLSLSSKGKNNRSGNSRARRDDSLQRLKRQDLLELLLEQIGENERLQEESAEMRRTIAELNDLGDRLKHKLDDKDEQIERLKHKLDDKDALIERLKKRLDMKDDIIAGLMAQGFTMPESGDAFEAVELLAVEERAVEAYLSKKGEGAPEEPEAAEPETEPETADAAEPEPEPEAAEPEPEPEVAEPEPADPAEPEPEAEAADAAEPEPSDEPDQDGDEQ